MAETKEQIQHSLLPWHVEHEARLERISVMSADGYYVTTPCFAPHDDDRITEQANADFIVRAVNHHEELVSVLREIVEALRVDAPGTPLNSHKYDGLGIRANAVLAKVESR